MKWLGPVCEHALCALLKRKVGVIRDEVLSSARCAAVKTDNPGIGFGQVGKKIGAMWGDLTSDEKVSLLGSALGRAVC